MKLNTYEITTVVRCVKIGSNEYNISTINKLILALVINPTVSTKKFSYEMLEDFVVEGLLTKINLNRGDGICYKVISGLALRGFVDKFNEMTLGYNDEFILDKKLVETC